MINKEKIITLIGTARKSYSELQRYSLLDNEDIISSDEKLGNLKYQFIILIEACIDICNHISARNFSIAPESYSHCFEILSNNNILSNDIAKRMAEFAKLRNLLVHLYWKVDDNKIVEILKNDLHFIDEFFKEVVTSIKI